MSAGKGFWTTAVIVAVIVVIAAAIGITGCGKSSKAEITGFKVTNQTSVKIDPETAQVKIEVKYGAKLTKLLARVDVSPKATVTPADSSTVDFSKPVIYKVTAQNGKTRNWTVKVVTLQNTEAEIKSLEFPGRVGAPQTYSNNITAVAKHGTDLKSLVPTIGISDSATIAPASGTPQDFSKGAVTYKVTPQDKKTIGYWTVTVTVAEPTKTIELTEIFLGGVKTVIDTKARTVRVELKKEVQLNAVVVTKLDGSFGKVKPALAVGDTLDFSNGAKTFVFSAQDTTVKSSEKWRFIAYYPAEEDSSKSVIKKGEGVEHALIRQILASPAAWGYVGSLVDRPAVRKWAESEAHRIAIKAGYVDYKTGKEIRVAKVGTVYHLADDQGVVVYEYASVEDYEKNAEAADVNVAAKTCKEGKFAGADKETIKKHVQSYEYVFNPSPCQLKVVIVPPPAPAPAQAPAPAPAQVQAPAPAPAVSFDDLPPVPVFPNLLE